MSGSLASAKAKRAGIQATVPPAQPSTPVQSKLTFQQVISVIDTRLIKLETEMKSKSVVAPAQAQAQAPAPAPADFMEEMDRKFMMLAEEITTMKDVVMKLQAFTMDVNKTLFEERIQIMSETCDIRPENIEEISTESEELHVRFRPSNNQNSTPII